MQCAKNQASTSVVAVPSSYGCNSCGYSRDLVVIGTFIKDVCFADCLALWEKRVASGKPITDLTDMAELLRCLFTFDSLTVKFQPNVGVGQACTFYVKPQVVGIASGASSHQEMPIYGNMIQQVPGYSLASLWTGTPLWMVPETLGQFELQINPFITAPLLLSTPIKNLSDSGAVIGVLNMAPALSKFRVEAGTPIFAGVV